MSPPQLLPDCCRLPGRIRARRRHRQRVAPCWPHSPQSQMALILVEDHPVRSPDMAVDKCGEASGGGVDLVDHIGGKIPVDASVQVAARRGATVGAVPTANIDEPCAIQRKVLKSGRQAGRQYLLRAGMRGWLAKHGVHKRAARDQPVM
jgi:hypothetical protein